MKVPFAILFLSGQVFCIDWSKPGATPPAGKLTANASNTPGHSHSSIEINDQAGMSFCDGALDFKASRTDCRFGYSFGQRIPECICFRGLYRMILDDCFESDGLSEGQVCTKPFDTQRESGAKIYAVQITQEINWDHAHVVCMKEERPGQKIWAAVPLRGNNQTATLILPAEEPDFYVINGNPYILDLAGGKQAICVQQHYVNSHRNDKICRYFRNDNDHWRTEKSLEITLRKDSCPPEAHQLIPSECFPSVRDESSECQLTCGKKAISKTVVSESRGMQRGNSEFPEESFQPLLRETPEIRFDNLFLDRKMLQYLLVSNTQEVSDLNNIKPRRTFELFDKMVAITKTLCPSDFVDGNWIDLVVSLFKVIHDGGGMVYDDSITEANYIWSKTILDTCLDTATKYPMILTAAPPPPSDPYDTTEATKSNVCAGIIDKAWGYCLNKTNCDLLSAVQVKPDPSKLPSTLHRKHYVPELAWSILDISQAICFNDFNSSYRMFHVVQQAVEELFTHQIRNLWYYPSYNDGASRVKSQLLGEMSDQNMDNLEICTGGIYDIINVRHRLRDGERATPIARLKRPQPNRNLYRRRKRETTAKPSISGGVDAYCLQRSKEWKYPDTCFKKN